jgi:hypothetical protein
LPRNEPVEVVREMRMKLGVVETVLNAADQWVSAQEALVAARAVSEETDVEEEAVDIAGARLVAAAMRWRASR